ncbi:MAG: hypothetical protein RLZZ11_2121 [Cyanobacteriota bacterium]
MVRTLTSHRLRSRLAGLLLAASLPVTAVLAALPAWAGSALAAWRISRSGELELRTPPGTSVEAFFEEGRGLVGPRLWLDLPGAPSRSRTIRGNGAVREVRVGRPNDNTTRLVVEFRPGTQLDPSQLRLVGTSPDRWSMQLGGALNGVESFGEGDFDAPSVAATPSWRARPPASEIPSGPMPSVAGLPDVPRGRYKVVIDPGAQLLQAKGVQVLLTRTSEVDVDLPPRVALANNSRADLFLSIHANALSLSRPDVNGIETFFFQEGPSKRLAEAVQTQMLRISPGSPDRGARPGRFFVIRRTVMPAALAEMGFVTGQLDSPRLADPAFRKRMAVAITTGLLNYLVANP